MESERESILGVDYGTHWVGLAICDPTGRYAVPIKSLIGLSGRALSRKISSIVRERDVRLVVIGCPEEDINNKGTHLVVTNVMRLKESLERGGVEVILQDEGYSSFAAVQVRKQLDGRSDRNQKKWIDSSAATIILQNFLDDRNKLSV